jgi:hypothetical protein
MKILYELPPNYEDICNHIPAVRKSKTIVFTYGDTVYVPSGQPLHSDLEAHEQVHIDRQSNLAEWWGRYLSDVQFRLDEELAAYRVQYAYALENYTRAHRRLLLTHISKDLSGAMYGKLITRKEAIKLITEGKKI